MIKLYDKGAFLLNGTELVELILKYYDLLSDNYKKLIPLKKVFIPIVKNN